MFACCFSLAFPKAWPWISARCTSDPEGLDAAAGASVPSVPSDHGPTQLLFLIRCVFIITKRSAGGFQLQALLDQCFHHVLNLEFFLCFFPRSVLFSLESSCLGFLLRICFVFPSHVKCLKPLLNSIEWWGPTEWIAGKAFVYPLCFLPMVCYRLTKQMPTVCS